MPIWPFWRTIALGLAATISSCAPAAKPSVKPVANNSLIKNVPAPLPHADAGRFAVVVADFSGNKETAADFWTELDSPHSWKNHEKDDVPQVLRLGFTVEAPNTPPNVDSAYRGHEEARHWLRKTGAQIVIWGQVREGKTGREIVLRLTGSRDRPSGGAFPMEHEISIPLPDVQMVFPVIRLAVAAEASGYEDMRGLGVGEELSQWIQQVEKSPTARSSQVRWLLARAYQARADRKGDADLFRQTLRQLDDMLTMAPRSDEPLIWARLQGMYGSVLQDWELTDPSDVMAVTAISKFVLAAEELTADRTPLDFVLVHNQLGLLQRRTAELFQSEPPLCRAVDMFWKASEISYDSDVPRYMDITLRGVQRSLSDLTRRLPTGQKPDCNPPIPETVWRTYLAGERM